MLSNKLREHLGHRWPPKVAILEADSHIVDRNERWTDAAASEPYEAVWACGAIIFIRVLKQPSGKLRSRWGS
jgi:hypothetical protein